MKSNLTTSYSLIQLKNNPIYFAKIISCACFGFKARKANVLDIYLILPILLYEAGIVNLKNANVRSSIQSVFLKDNIIGIAGLQKRIDMLNKKTVESFILASNMKLIDIDYSNLDVEVTKKGAEEVARCIKVEKRLCREAMNLGKVLSRNEVKENYRLLGVKSI